MYGAMAQSTNMNQPLWGYSWGYDIIIIISCHITNIIYIYMCVYVQQWGINKPIYKHLIGENDEKTDFKTNSLRINILYQ